MQPFDKIREYSKSVCNEVRWKKAHSVIAEEIENHLIDQRDAYISDGLNEADATDNAIIQMGDPVAIGTQLDRTHKPKPQWNMLILTTALLLIGLFARLFIVYSGNVWRMPTQIISSVIGIGLMAAAYFSDFTLIGKFPKTIYFSILSLSVAALILSPTINGRAYYAGFFTLLFPLGFVAVLYSMRNKGYLGIIICGISFLLPAFIALQVPIISGFLLFAVSGLIILSIAINKGWFNVNRLFGYLLVFIPTFAALLFAVINMFAESYRLMRLRLAINPSIDPAHAGYMSVVTRNLLNGSKLIGRGDMPAEYAKFQFPLPNSGIDTDNMLTFIIFKTGWIAFIVIMAVLLFFIIKGFILCFRQKSSLGLFVSVAVMLTFTFQVIGYVISNLGFQLIAPISLPLITYGKIANSINLILVGIMLSVFRTGDIAKDKNVDKIRNNSFITWDDGKLIISFSRK